MHLTIALSSYRSRCSERVVSTSRSCWVLPYVSCRICLAMFVLPHLSCRMYCRLHILRRYAALPDEKKPFAAPSNRKHVTEDSSSEVEETGYQHGALDNNVDEAAIDSQEQSDLLQHKTQPSRSGVTESDDTARAQQLGGQVPAQRLYTQRPQLPQDWQR